MTRSLHASAVALACGALLALLALPGAVHARELPAFKGLVNDYANVLPPERAAALEAKLSEHQRRTQQQFALLTVPSLKGESIEAYAVAVFKHWGVGDKKRDDGLLLVFAPNDRKVRIETGYGLEGAIPDAIGARVIRDVMAPKFRANDYAGGLDAAFDALIATAGGDPNALPPEPQRARGKTQVSLLPLLLPFIFFFVLSKLGGGRRGRRRGLWIMGPGFGGGFGGGGFSSGGFGGGGFGGGGGGFGGGGGGSSGGGGASGSW